MLLVKTKLGPSKIEGIGLFADEDIKKGTKVWQHEPVLDIFLSEEEVQKLSIPAQEEFRKYSYFDKKRNKYMLCGDNARFWNHSNEPNCNETIDSNFALRDIHIGEELTINYRELGLDMNEHPELK